MLRLFYSIFVGIVIFVSAVQAAATIRLYLKDGEFHLVREYQVLQDRVKYYSVERGDWEEIPVELVDLKRTKSELASNLEETKKQESQSQCSFQPQTFRHARARKP